MSNPGFAGFDLLLIPIRLLLVLVPVGHMDFMSGVDVAALVVVQAVRKAQDRCSGVDGALTPVWPLPGLVAFLLKPAGDGQRCRSGGGGEQSAIFQPIPMLPPSA